MDTIRTRLIEILKHTMEDMNEIEFIDGNTELGELGISSINMVKLFVYIENEFNISFDEEALIGEDFEVVDDLVNYIYSLKNDK